jgi:hypothetical protein
MQRATLRVWGNKKRIHNFRWRISREGQDVNGRIILKRYLKHNGCDNVRWTELCYGLGYHIEFTVPAGLSEYVKVRTTTTADAC